MHMTFLFIHFLTAVTEYPREDILYWAEITGQQITTHTHTIYLTRNTQHATNNLQPATDNLQPVTCNLQPAPDSQ